MNNIIVYCEINEARKVADVSLELCSKARKLADTLGVAVEAAVLCDKIEGLEEQLYPYGVDTIFYACDERLFPFSTLPHFSIMSKLFEEQKPQIALFGATCTGRDLAPRLASRMRCGLTADCTSLEIADYADNRQNKVCQNILHQIRPAFGGNIIATIVNPDTRPQMATVREGVMKKERIENRTCKLVMLPADKYLTPEDFRVSIVERKIETKKINIKNAQIIVAGGYGVGSKENFELLHRYAELIGGEVGATRAAVDAGFAEPERQIGQTGVTVRPKLYIACGISGAVQHRAGMEESAKIISINTDPSAPICAIADYNITGDVMEVLPKLINSYIANQK